MDFTKVFITGDRLMTPFYPGLVIMEMLKARDKGMTVVTGTNDGGVEQLARMIADSAGMTIEVIEQSALDVPDNPGNWIDWDARHLSLSEDTEVVAIHVDPMTAREIVSAVNVLPPERVRLVTMLDLMAETDGSES